MGLNTYPSNPFPPSTDRMDADTLEAEVNQLKSGLTNYEATTNAALDLPENTGKNVLPITINQLKTLNTGGTWNDNVYAYKSLTYTVETDTRGYITSIKVNGTADSQAVFVLFNGNIGTGSYTLNGITGGSGSTYLFYAASAFGEVYSEKTANVSGSFEIDLYVRSEVTLSNQMFYPMIRPATITDATYTPYIPSVESRIEAVESGLEKATMIKTSETVTLNANGISRLSLTLSQGRIVYAIKVEGDNNAYLVLPYCTTVDGGVWAVKVVNPDDMSPIASAEVTIAYGYLP